MLLDIYEPGQTPLPHADEESIAIGIDLGTTNSAVAIAKNGEVEFIKDESGAILMPSVVELSLEGRVQESKQSAARLGEGVIEPTSPSPTHHSDSSTLPSRESITIASIKRHMGKAVEVEVAGIKVKPVEISAEILKRLKARAEKALGKEVRKAVITVPAYFNDSERTATRDAARLAGLEVLRLVAEPTAAALAYGLDESKQGIYAIYDLGGGTFDFSLLKLEMGVFQVLAVGGDTALGGDDFDAAISSIIYSTPMGRVQESKQSAARLGEGMVSEPSPDRSGRNAPSLSDSPHGESKTPDSRIIKEILTTANESYGITRTQFEDAIRPLVQKTIDISQAVIADAGIATNEIQGIVLVGGSTRVPLVQQMVEQFFGRKPLTDIDPDLAVTAGAALQAAALTGNGDHLLLDVIPLSLGVETMGGIVEKFIWRNSPIPTSVTNEFTTYQDGQNGMIFHIVQGEREMAADCRSLATFELKGIPALPAGVARIKVTFTVDADGILSVAASEETTGIQAAIEVKPSYGIGVDEMEAMIRASMENAKEDMEARLLAEEISEARRSLLAVEGALHSDGDLLDANERKQIEDAIGELKSLIAPPLRGSGRVADDAWVGDFTTNNAPHRSISSHELPLQGGVIIDRTQIHAAAEALENSIKTFAEKRMNKAITEAMLGRDINSYS